MVARLTDFGGSAADHRQQRRGTGEGTFLETSDGQWQRMLAVHVRGAGGLRPGRPAGDARGRMGAHRGPSDRTAAWTGDATVPYATAKAALVGFTRSLAREVAAAGVRVNLVAPGPVETPMLLHDSPAHLEAELRDGAAQLVHTEEVAGSVAFLCGPAGDAYVGQVLSPNGGTVFT